jgi:hypothetical protein
MTSDKVLNQLREFTDNYRKVRDDLFEALLINKRVRSVENNKVYIICAIDIYYKDNDIYFVPHLQLNLKEDDNPWETWMDITKVEFI